MLTHVRFYKKNVKDASYIKILVKTCEKNHPGFPSFSHCTLKRSTKLLGYLLLISFD